MTFTPQQFSLLPQPVTSLIQVGSPVVNAGSNPTLLYNTSITEPIYLSGSPSINVGSTDYFVLVPQSALIVDGTESVYAAVVNNPAVLQALPGSVQFANGIVSATTVIIFGTTGGLFIFDGIPVLGNPPILSISNVDEDPVGNTITPSLSLSGLPFLVYSSAAAAGNLIAAISGQAGMDNFGNPYIAGGQFGAPDSNQIQLIPNPTAAEGVAGSVAIGQAITGIFAGTANLTTSDANEMLGGVLGAAVLGQSPDTKMSAILTSPFGTQGSAFILTAQNDAGTDTAWSMIGAVTTPDDETLVFTPIAWFAPYAFVLYSGESGITVVTKTSGSGNIPIPAGVTVGVGESWGTGGSLSGASGGVSAEGGCGGGEYSQEPNLALTPSGDAAYVVPVSGSGNNTTLAGASETVTAHPGQPGSVSSWGDGGTGSTNTIHNDGARGGNPSFAQPGSGGGGGASASSLGTGGHGNAGGPNTPGAGGTALSGGGNGGSGGQYKGNGSPGKSPGGGGGGGSSDFDGAIGGNGQVRLTYSTGAPIVLASISSAAVTDPFGTSIPAGGMMPALVAVEPGTADTPESWHYVGSAGQPAFGSGWSNVGSPNEDLAYKLLTEKNAVWIKGYVNNATAANTASIFTLPTGYRPNSQQFFTMTEDPNSTITLKALLVTTAGVVELAPGLGTAGQGNYLIDCIMSLDI